MSRASIAVGLGEVLWDLLPAGKQLGGAPANFAYMMRLLGHRGVVVSRVGADALGGELRTRLGELGLESHVQTDASHATGTVQVRLDRQGQPEYEITESVAWDFLEWTPAWRELAAQAGVMCWGSLAQRAVQSRATIRQFVAGARRTALRIFDVNLRQKFYSAEVLAISLRLANVAKLNEHELPVVMGELGLSYDHKDQPSAAARLRRAFNLKMVCVTRGEEGSLLVTKSGRDEHPGFPVRVADSVGAGDAFTAALAHHMLAGSSLRVMNAAANRMGAWVASQSGATPAANPNIIETVQ